MNNLLHLKFWYWLGTAGTAIAGGLFMGLFAEDSAEAAWGKPAPEIAVTYERLNGYKILAIAGIMIAIGLIAKGRDFAKLAASIGGIMLLVFIGHAFYGDARGYVSSWAEYLPQMIISALILISAARELRQQTPTQ